ncbi:MAG TPA: hypothetical protein VIR58_09475, partial [Acidimicrobiales bacterium]
MTDSPSGTPAGGHTPDVAAPSVAPKQEDLSAGPSGGRRGEQGRQRDADSGPTDDSSSHRSSEGREPSERGSSEGGSGDGGSGDGGSSEA